jgi:dihydroflavonol-4-reductase
VSDRERVPMARYPADPRPVLVTGANGHLGFNLVSALVARGYTVRAGVRDRHDENKTAPLRALGAETVDAELQDHGALVRAAEGTQGIFHVAAVVQFWAQDPEADIIRPTMEGARNVIDAARRAGVRRVVMTSSIAAVGVDASPENPLTEEQWNMSPATPYTKAKTRAERLAWDLASEAGLDLVTVIPATIVGPGFHRHTPVTRLFDLVLRGWLPFALPAQTSYVDARDIADAQISAFELPAARGRYLVSGEFLSLYDLVSLIADYVPGVRKPYFVLPVRLLPPLIPVDWLVSKIVGTPRQLTPEMFEEFANRRMICSSAKARLELGWTPRPIRDSVAATVDWLRSHSVA